MPAGLSELRRDWDRFTPYRKPGEDFNRVQVNDGPHTAAYSCGYTRIRS